MEFISLWQVGRSAGRRQISGPTLSSACDGVIGHVKRILRVQRVRKSVFRAALSLSRLWQRRVHHLHGSCCGIRRFIPSSYIPQTGDGGAGAGHRGNGGSAHLWTTYGPKNSCRCSEHCLELSCDHGRMRFVKCYVCGSDWLIPAVKPNPLKELKIKPIPTKVVRW